MGNGIVLESHNPTWAYDACSGHSDKNHHYHYHIPPLCYLKTLGVTTPDDPEWWLWEVDGIKTVKNYTDMAAAWPEISLPSPLVGFARDGFPIYGPYNDSGMRQSGKDYGGDLDECNGKTDMDGKYGYYLTVDPPFSPPCLRGEIGSFDHTSTQVKCPADGIFNTIIPIGGLVTNGDNDNSGGTIVTTPIGGDVIDGKDDTSNGIDTDKGGSGEDGGTADDVEPESGADHLGIAVSAGVGILAITFFI